MQSIALTFARDKISDMARVFFFLDYKESDTLIVSLAAAEGSLQSHSDGARCKKIKEEK